MKENLEFLRMAVGNLTSKGLKREAIELQSMIDEMEVVGQSGDPIADILSAYKTMHKIAEKKNNVKIAVIRKDNECPFGLPIPQACIYAGDSTADMEENGKLNKAIYNTERTHERCVYAGNVLENNDAVECNHGSVLQGQKSIKMFHGNPQYPKMWSGFSGINLDRGYHSYSQQYGNEVFPFPSIYG